MAWWRATFVVLVLACASLATAGPAAQAPAAALQDAFAKSHSGSAAGVVKLEDVKGGGRETTLGGLKAYVATPANKPPSAAVLLITDVFGWQPQAIRTWADKLAAKGFLAVVPDFFRGNPRKKSDTPDTFPAWLDKFPAATVEKDAAAVLADIRKAHPTVKKLGVQGFCWGGLYAVLLTAGSPPPVSAAVVYHGSRLTAANVKGINAPIMFQQSDPQLDSQIGPAFFKEIEQILASKRAKGLDASITAYPKQAHGFSMRGDMGNATVAQAANTAFAAGAAFLEKHLK